MTLSRNEDNDLDAFLRQAAPASAEQISNKAGSEVGRSIEDQQPVAAGMECPAPVVDEQEEPTSEIPQAMGMVSPAEVQQQAQRKAWQEAAFWAECASLYLRPVSKGGLCSKVEAKGPSVIFHIGESAKPLGWLQLDGMDNRLSVQIPKSHQVMGHAISDIELARAMVEAGRKMGWQTMSFKGPRAFVEAATSVAREAKMNVVDPKTFKALQKARETAMADVEPESGPAPK